MTKKKSSLRIVALGAALVVAAAGVTTSFACTAIPEDIGLESGRLRPCPDSPNCVVSEGDAANVDPFPYTGDGNEALTRLADLMVANENARIETLEPPYAHVVFTTSLMRFRDDVELRVDEANGVIQVRSASRVGHSDLGANRDRVERIRALWAEAGN